MVLIEEKTEVVGGYSYEVVVSQGQPAHSLYNIKFDPAKIYLDVWVTDEVNSITDEHAVFELTDCLKKLSIPNKE